MLVVIEAVFARVNTKTRKISWNPEASFRKKFESIEEYVAFVVKCNYGVKVFDNLSPEQYKVYRDKVIARIRRTEQL